MVTNSIGFVARSNPIVINRKFSAEQPACASLMYVFGAKGRDGWVPLYNEKDPFHETFVTLGFLAAVTKTIGLSTGILIAPQRQTGVIAKQAAEVDVLSGGRLRLGIGVGWNHIEYEALGIDWKTRGARQAEQVEVLRRLWSG